jgi:IS605 OrfB family transposase
MQRTVKIKLENDIDLVKTIEQYAIIKQWICNYGLQKKSFNKNKLHKWTYKKLKKLYPDMPTGILQTARDVASETLKRTKLKKAINGKQYSSVRLDKRNLRVDMMHNKISISSINGRKKIIFNDNPMTLKYKTWSAIAGTLCFKENNLYLNLVLEKDNPPQINLRSIKKENIVGIDRGIINIAVLSNNQFFHSNHLKDVKGKYQYLKKVLQSKGTKSAIKKLKEISRKETRFVSDTNHCLSKTIANSNFKVFSIETLKFTKNKKNGRKFNKKIGGWSYKQLERFLGYKVEALGKIIVKAPSNFPSSQICSHCGHKDKENRNGSKFKCLKCNFELHSDLNASRNLADFGKSEISRLLVNQPNVATQVSYKPINSLIGN